MKRILMEIPPMAEIKKMPNKQYKYWGTFIFSIFLLSFVFSCASANTYGSGEYSSDIYSIGNEEGGTSSGSRPSTVKNKPIQQLQQPTPQTNQNLVSLDLKRTLRFGMTGEDIRQLQVYLNTHGYVISSFGAGAPGKETNYFGPKTKVAVIKLQLANKLVGDGIVGPLTRAVLK